MLSVRRSTEIVRIQRRCLEPVRFGALFCLFEVTTVLNAFTVKTKIAIGDCLAETLAGYRRAFIVTDGFMSESGKVDYVLRRLPAGTEYQIFSEVQADPDIEMVVKGMERMAAFAPDVVIAFGGGSPIDAAKAIVYFSRWVEKMPVCPLVAVPTTSGTGSEVSRFAVLTDLGQKVKYPLVDDSLLPDVAVLDAELVRSLPPAITADTGMDVFTHAVESFVSTNANDFSKAMSREAMKLVSKHLLTVFREPDNLQARQEMHNASCMAGIAFSNAGLGINHSMAHALGGHFHISHGRANAILLPYVMSYNAGCVDSLTPAAKGYASIARSIGLQTASVRQSALNLIHASRRYVEKMGIPASIKEAGIIREDFDAALDQMVQAALSDRCTKTNPRACTAADLKAVFKKAYIGKLP